MPFFLMLLQCIFNNEAWIRRDNWGKANPPIKDGKNNHQSSGEVEIKNFETIEKQQKP